MSPDSPKSQPKGGKRTRIRRWVIPVGIIALVLCLGCFISCKTLYPEGTLLPGIMVNDIDLSQFSAEQAEERLRAETARATEVMVRYQYEDYALDTSLSELLVLGDVAAALAPVWQQEAALTIAERFGAMYLHQTRHYEVELLAPNAARQAELTDEWNARWGRELVEPQMALQLNKVSVVPGQSGLKVAAQATFDPLYSSLGASDQPVLPIIFEQTEPTEDEQGLHRIAELSRCTTNFKEREINRSANLRLAAEQINGTALQPGEVFSFNARVGQRTWEAGYRDALVVVGSKFEPELGGGICQVSSTLYDAVLLAGLEIVERACHGLPVAYIPLGLDATVYWGVQDFKFRNSNEHPVYIGVFSEAGSGQLTICLYGDRDEKRHIKLRNSVDSYLPYSTQIKLDTSLAPGQVTVDNAGAGGYRARGFQDIYDETGEVLVETITLSHDYYRPSPRILIVGMNPDGSDPTVVGLPSGEGAPAPAADDASGDAAAAGDDTSDTAAAGDTAAGDTAEAPADGAATATEETAGAAPEAGAADGDPASAEQPGPEIPEGGAPEAMPEMDDLAPDPPAAEPEAPGVPAPLESGGPGAAEPGNEGTESAPSGVNETPGGLPSPL